MRSSATSSPTKASSTPDRSMCDGTSRQGRSEQPRGAAATTCPRSFLRPTRRSSDTGQQEFPHRPIGAFAASVKPSSGRLWLARQVRSGQSDGCNWGKVAYSCVISYISYATKWRVNSVSQKLMSDGFLTLLTRNSSHGLRARTRSEPNESSVRHVRQNTVSDITDIKSDLSVPLRAHTHVGRSSKNVSDASEGHR
jgi:hypothetical protein